jgi:hypothetical protein
MASKEAQRTRKSSGSYARMENASRGVRPKAFWIAPAAMSGETTRPWRALSTTTTTARRRLSSMSAISCDTGR